MLGVIGLLVLALSVPPLTGLTGFVFMVVVASGSVGKVAGFLCVTARFLAILVEFLARVAQFLAMLSSFVAMLNSFVAVVAGFLVSRITNRPVATVVPRFAIRA